MGLVRPTGEQLEEEEAIQLRVSQLQLACQSNGQR